MLKLDEDEEASDPEAGVFVATDGSDVFDEAPTAVFDDVDAAVGCDSFGRVPNQRLARSITYKGQQLRVWAHEFSQMTVEKMQELILGDERVYELVLNDDAGRQLIIQLKTTDQRFLYDAALIDGCNEAQARAVALRQSIDDAEIEFPALGWYRLDKNYAALFCDKHEMEE